MTTTLGMLQEEIRAGRLTRRQVLVRATSLGLTAPVIAGLLAACGGDDDDDDEAPTTESANEQQATATEAEVATEAPTEGDDEEESASPVAGAETPADEASATPGQSSAGSGQGRGVGDTLRILNWQAPTDLNPHFSQGYHNSAPSFIVLEPLLHIDADGNIHPVLVEEAPSLENGLLSSDGRTVTYTLLEGLVWSDGEPFTSEDARFTWEWVLEEGTTPTSIQDFQGIEDVEIIDERTFTVHFSEPTPTWFNAFSLGSGLGAQIVPRHMLDEYRGADAVNAPFNLHPIGTGPYKIVEFRPGDVVLYEINELYREPDKPYFKTVEFKGGGDAASAARAVLQTGEADFAPNLQVEAQVLLSLAEGGSGELVVTPGSTVEGVHINFADPNVEIEGARSEPSTQHPFFTELAVRQALALACDRQSIAEQLYGPSGEASSNVVTLPTRFASPNTSFKFDLDAAAALLDEAGWVKEGDTRRKGDVELRVLFQTTVNALRQRTQEVLKQAWEELGFTTELKTVDASVMFSTDAGNPDTYLHFYSDLQLFTHNSGGVYPISLMNYFKSVDPESDIASKANNWLGENLYRWRNDEFNELYVQATTEIDPEVQNELFIAMNDLIVNEVVEIPLVARNAVAARSTRLMGTDPSPWTQFTYNIADWYFEE